MTGKAVKLTAQEREKLREDKINERINYERVKLN